jgi:hypothetical protein
MAKEIQNDPRWLPELEKSEITDFLALDDPRSYQPKRLLEVVEQLLGQRVQ